MRVVHFGVRGKAGALAVVAVALVLGVALLAVGFVLAVSAAAIALALGAGAVLYRPLSRKRRGELDSVRRDHDLDPSLEVFPESDANPRRLPGTPPE